MQGLIDGKTALGLAAALAGGAAGAALGLPAGWLIGASAAAMALALAGRPASPPQDVRNVAFLVLGATMGSSVDDHAIATAGRWPISLLVLALAVFLMMAAGSALLRRGFGYDANTARLASAPGALSAVLAASLEVPCDARKVILLQSLRLLVLAALLPLALGFAAPATRPAFAITNDWLMLGLVLGLGAGLGWALNLIKAPAAWLLGGMLVSLALHLGGFMHGRPPVWLTAPAYAVTGAAVGGRFYGVTRAELVESLGAAFSLLALLSVIGGALALLASRLSGVPFAQSAIAFAPGGVEGMAAAALALGYDAAYVGAHHLARILGLTLSAALWTRR